ncbi:MAG: hypothetical protein QY323_04645 [Patescibacteria group bacterium]|nr:MAG: hypothetical protein QY323_04645 [Patescibacteria group bacterium]
MRSITLILSLALVSLTGCLWGSQQAKTKTVYRHDNGIYPATETSIEQTYAGNTFGASVPIVMGGGYGYDPATGMVYGQGGYGAGGSSFCVQYPTRCASNVVLNVPQPNVVMTGGYGSQVTFAAGSAGTYNPAPQADYDEVQQRLLDVEKQTAVIGPALKEQLRLQCQMFLANPDVIEDEDKREKLVQSCTKQLAK